MLKTLKMIVTKIDSLTYYLFPTPKISDNFAFKNDQEKIDYYKAVSPFINEPTEKFSIKKIVIFLSKSILIYILFLLCFVLYYKIFF